MDKSTRNHLSALDAFIKQQAAELQPIQPGEFSVYDYIEKLKQQGIKVGFSKAVRMMNGLVDSGAVTSRKATQDGRNMNFYRFL